MLVHLLQIAAYMYGNFVGLLYDPTFIIMLVVVAGVAAVTRRTIYPIGLTILCAISRYYISWSNMTAAGLDAHAFALYSGFSTLIGFLLIVGIVRLIRRIVS